MKISPQSSEQIQTVIVQSLCIKLSIEPLITCDSRTDLNYISKIDVWILKIYTVLTLVMLISYIYLSHQTQMVSALLMRTCQMSSPFKFFSSTSKEALSPHVCMK